MNEKNSSDYLEESGLRAPAQVGVSLGKVGLQAGPKELGKNLLGKLGGLEALAKTGLTRLIGGLAGGPVGIAVSAGLSLVTKGASSLFSRIFGQKKEEVGLKGFDAIREVEGLAGLGKDSDLLIAAGAVIVILLVFIFSIFSSFFQNATSFITKPYLLQKPTTLSATPTLAP